MKGNVVISEYREPVQVAYLTWRQAADHFGVTTKTIYRWAASGRLTAHGDGPRRLGVTTKSVQALSATRGGAR